MGAVLFVLFILIPILELAVIIQVGQVIGVGWTLVALIAMSLIGAALVKAEGLRAWRRVQEALAETRMPAVEVVDGALVLLGGALMLTPGFLTDAVGLLLVVPLTRAVINRTIRSRVRGAFGLPRRRHGQRGPGPATSGADDARPDDTVVALLTAILPYGK
jgi:UPF0716 protein FxsA